MPSDLLQKFKLTAAQRKAIETFNNLGVEITDKMAEEILGPNPTPLETKKPKETAEVVEHVEILRGTVESDASVRESELVLRSLSVPEALRIVACSECNLPFGTNYRYISYCSNECRAAATYRKFGITYDFSVPDQERYYPTIPPAVIRPENLQALRAWARHILELPEPVEEYQAVEVILEEAPQTVEVPTEEKQGLSVVQQSLFQLL